MSGKFSLGDAKPRTACNKPWYVRIRHFTKQLTCRPRLTASHFHQTTQSVCSTTLSGSHHLAFAYLLLFHIFPNPRRRMPNQLALHYSVLFSPIPFRFLLFSPTRPNAPPHLSETLYGLRDSCTTRTIFLSVRIKACNGWYKVLNSIIDLGSRPILSCLYSVL